MELPKIPLSQLPQPPANPNAGVQLFIRAGEHGVHLEGRDPATNTGFSVQLDPDSARRIGVALISGAHQPDKPTS
jgi:hypothetical protein